MSDIIVTGLDASLSKIQDLLQEARVILPDIPDEAIALIDMAQKRLEEIEQAQLIQERIVGAQMRMIEKLRDQRDDLLAEISDLESANAQAYEDGYDAGTRAAGMDALPNIAELVDMTDCPPEPQRGTAAWVVWHNALSEADLSRWFMSLSVAEQAEYQRWAAQ